VTLNIERAEPTIVRRVDFGLEAVLGAGDFRRVFLCEHNRLCLLTLSLIMLLQLIAEYDSAGSTFSRRSGCV